MLNNQKNFQKNVLNKRINYYICSPLEIAGYFYIKKVIEGL